MRMNLANSLTLSRLVLSPVFVALYAATHTASTGAVEGMLGAKIALLLVAWSFELTDIFDGIVARRLRQTTNFGKIVDPLADSISRLTVFICFLWGGYAGLWMVVAIFWRDSIVAFLRSIAARAGVTMGARNSGKIKAIIQGVVIITILSMVLWQDLVNPALNVRKISYSLMWVATLVTLWSLVDYLYGARTFLRTILGEGGAK